ncbi:MAG: ribosome assembly RNA-binding protein YhbY [Clostridia bacterium]|nr:ribosome assembly RNA-binding protein YhbY [Clostridia bacterium]
MLTPKQRSYLRSLATSLDPIFQVGKGGVGDEMIRGVSDALEARELIKLRVLEYSGLSAREAAETIAAATGADVVTVIGSRFVLYRKSEKKQRIEIHV